LLGCHHSIAPSEDQKAADDEAAVTVSAKPIEKRAVGRTITMLGRCEALPEKRALVTSVIEGQIGRLLAKQGDKVTIGQPLVQLDTQLSEADVAEKLAARDSADASLRLLQAPPRPEDKRTAELAVDQAEIAVHRAEAQVERLNVLRDRNEIPEAQIFEAQEALKQARLQQQTAQTQSDLVSLPPRSEAVAEAKSKVTVSEKAIDTAKARLAMHSIKAPIAGVLNGLTCHPGQTVSVGMVIGEIVDNGELVVIAWAPVDKSPAIHNGQKARVRTSNEKTANVTEGEKEDSTDNARVSFVGLSTDAQTGNVPLQILVDNKQGKLIVGQTLTVDVEVTAPTEMLCVPREAIHDEGDDQALTVVRNGKAVVLHPKFGDTADGWVAIVDGDVKEGELVAVSGAYNLPDGTPVKVEDSSAESPATPKTATE
jgi:RND family efflux transporter MFP subunit